MRRFLPVIVLILIAPLVAELLGGSTPITLPIAWPFLLPIYSAGALLIRELVRRRGRGWASILLLGAVYGLIEEGLATQSLFNPTLYNASHWGARIFGINGVYTEFVIVIHAIWSVAIPILLTDLLFPAQRNVPYLGRIGLIVTGICYVLSFALLWVTAIGFIAPGYMAPPILHILVVLIVIVLVVVALGVLPRKAPGSRLLVSAPQPWVVLLVSGIAAFLWLALLGMLWWVQPAFARWPLVLFPMLSALAVLGVMIWLVRQWAQSRDWSDRHLLALCSGALVSHTLVGILVITHTTADRVGLIVLGLVMIVLLVLFAIRVRARVRSDDSPSAESGSSPVVPRTVG
ncbi:MAG TPA: hypothetical protein VFB12_04595 [Ktedonobacteraceae bacterium]|nr:hypothetical protein [Ktedonobacteraceae bacterium]